jgi:hypothetical protein
MGCIEVGGSGLQTVFLDDVNTRPGAATGTVSERRVVARP